jgi:hypothetical protein
MKAPSSSHLTLVPARSTEWRATLTTQFMVRSYYKAGNRAEGENDAFFKWDAWLGLDRLGDLFRW